MNAWRITTPGIFCSQLDSSLKTFSCVRFVWTFFLSELPCMRNIVHQQSLKISHIMQKKKNKEENPVQENILSDFRSPFILKGKTLQVKINGHPIEKPVEKKFQSEKELQDLIMQSGKTLFGGRIMILDGKKVMPQLRDNYPPPAFLIDFTNLEKPKLYLVEVMVSKEDFRNLFFRITGLFSFLREKSNRVKLADVVTGFIYHDKMLKKEFKGVMEINKILGLIYDSITSNPNILLVTDSERAELAGFRETYKDTWGEMLKPVLIRKFSSSGETIITQHPCFDDIRNGKKKRGDNAPRTEASHLENVSESVKGIYEKIKAELLKKDTTLQFNPQKYYISAKKNRNLAFFHLRKKNLYLVVMYPEKQVRKAVKHHIIKSLPASVQKFWNGASTGLVIESTKHLNEIIFLLKKLVAGV